MEIVTHYSNTPELLSGLRRMVEALTTIVVEEDEPDLSMAAPANHDWRVRDRLSPAGIDQLVESFKHGTTIPELMIR